MMAVRFKSVLGMLLTIKRRWRIAAAMISATLFTLSDAPPTLAALIQWGSDSGGNDHYYELVSSGTISWTSAKTVAARCVPLLGLAASV